MTLADCRRPLFACRMIYQSSPAVVILGQPPPTFLTAVPVVWNAFEARETTLLLIPNSAATLVKVIARLEEKVLPCNQIINYSLFCPHVNLSISSLYDAVKGGSRSRLSEKCGDWIEKGKLVHTSNVIWNISRGFQTASSMGKTGTNNRGKFDGV
ncbi:hypothetical protein TNCV_4161551 [Trichonephila clavipes]|nr:hypothetical protein TNCV_4161551 [Trichonephila clavipes]